MKVWLKKKGISFTLIGIENGFDPYDFLEED
jgi:hypothetical protein